MKDERFIVTYRIEASTYEEAKSIAWAVQVEQTIEFPYEFVTDPYIKETITGRLESLELYSRRLSLYQCRCDAQML